MMQTTQQDIRLVLLETSGNQNYVFATNKLKDVVGGSELIRLAGTTFVEKAVADVFNREFSVKELCNERSIADAEAQGVEVIVATSGKALLLVDGEENAKKLVTAWTLQVLQRAPGMDATGAISSRNSPIDVTQPESIVKAMRDVYRRFETLRSTRISPLARFPRLPIVAGCTFSGYPASGLVNQGEEMVLASAPCIAKRDYVEAARDHLAALHSAPELAPCFRHPNEIEKWLDSFMEGLNWLAVIHADGNGLGQLLLNLDKHVPDGMTYTDCYRRFSQELDTVCEYAYKHAVSEVLGSYHEKHCPIIPVVVAGDDLTVFIEGEYAIQFAKVFVEKFSELTKDEVFARTISKVCAKATEFLRGDRLGVCAGVSITKPHFPFWKSYDLAEELMQRAKAVKAEVGLASSALDFHILYDSSATSIESIRKKLEDRQPVLTVKPFVVHDARPIAAENTWLAAHHLRRFEDAVEALKMSDKETKAPALPSSQAHYIRSLLHDEDCATIEAEWNVLLAKPRYKTFKNGWKEKDGKILDSSNATIFMDALEAREFMKTCPANLKTREIAIEEMLADATQNAQDRV